MTNKKNDLSVFANIKPQGVLMPDVKASALVADKRAKKEKVPRKAPWQREGLDPNKIVNVSFRISEVEREMLKYIRTQSGASANHTLRSLVIPEIKETAAELWKKDPDMR